MIQACLIVYGAEYWISHSKIQQIQFLKLEFDKRISVWINVSGNKRPMPIYTGMEVWECIYFTFEDGSNPGNGLVKGNKSENPKSLRISAMPRSTSFQASFLANALISVPVQCKAAKQYVESQWVFLESHKVRLWQWIRVVFHLNRDMET